MEPPPIGGGNLLDATDLARQFEASMEPPPIGGGNSGKSAAFVDAQTLQWSRLQSEAVIVHEVWTGCFGNLLQWSRLQSEAVIDSSERYAVIVARFNGAASNRRR